MAKGHIGCGLRLFEEHKGWLLEVVAFQPEVEERFEIAVWEADCIVVLQGREHIYWMVERQLVGRYMAMLL